MPRRTPVTRHGQVDAYIAGFPEETRRALEQMRAAIVQEAPGATERISYGIPTFDLAGQHLVHFGGFARHVGFYPTPSGVQAFEKELAGYECAKGSVRFPLDQPMPLDLVRRIVRFRLAEVTGQEAPTGAPALGTEAVAKAPGRLTAEILWSLPRVGNPAPAPDGSFVVVPVTTYDLEANAGTTRLWRVDARSAAARPLTGPDASSSEPAVSRDGRWLAFVRTPGGSGGSAAKGGASASTMAGPRHGDQAQLYRMRLDGGEAERLTDMPLGATLPMWLPDGRLAFLAPVLRDALTPDATAAELERRARLTTSARVTEDRVYRYWDRWLTDGAVHHVFVIDPAGGQPIDVTPASTRWLPFMEREGHVAVSPDGAEVAFTAEREAPPYDLVRPGVYTATVPPIDAGPIAAVPPRLLTEHHPGPAFRPAYSPDGRFLVYGLQRDVDYYADRQRIAVYDRTTGTHTVLTEAWDVDWASEWTFAGGDLVLAAEVAGRRSLFVLDLARAVADPAARTPRLLAADGWHGAPQVAGDQVFATLHALARPPEVVAYPLGGGPPTVLTTFATQALAGTALGRVEEISVAGAGGEPVQVLLVHPPEPAGRHAEGAHGPRPLVHLIHGGPHGSFGDFWHWRWNAQVFAAAGYLVAMVNFHGSSGWGEAFTSSILGRWGDQPYADVMAATDALVERGMVDPARLTAAGGSYGGYLVSWIATQTKRFACLVNHAGVCDFQTQYASDVTQGRNRSFGGEPWERQQAMDRYNPMRHAAGFRSPMLVIHGEKDYRVPFDQGLAIYNVYKAMGLPARLLTFPDEGHWILKPGNSLRWYAEVLAWLDRWTAAPGGTGGAGQKSRRRKSSL